MSLSELFVSGIPGRQWQYFSYDASDRMTKVSSGTAEKSFVYDEQGSVLSTLSGDKSRAYLNYDNAGRLTGLLLQINNLGTLGDYKYTYDANGNITAISYKGDSIGNGSISYTYDALNRLTKENLRDGSSKEYTYDAAGNRLTNKSTGAIIAQYEYDADGRRTSTITPSGTTKYFYDGTSTNVLYETDGSGNLLARYIYGSDYKPEIMIRGGNTYYYHYNGHGDVVALTDQNGTVVAEYDYDAYGLPVTTGLEGTVINPYRYAGYRYDSETGFYYLNARYYWAEVGRFITRDTFHGFEDEPASLNQYNYAQSNPLKYVDPSGHINIITVRWAGAVFNQLISVAIGGVVAGGITAYIRRVGVQAAARIFTKTITSKLTAWGAGKLAVGLTYAVGIYINYLDIGVAVAKWIDARDKSPNNGWLTI